MNDDSTFYCFRDGVLLEVIEPDIDAATLDVADSWLVEDGRTRALDRHFLRFGKAIAKISQNEINLLPEFFVQVLNKIPDQGRWFPRVEFHSNSDADNHLHLRVRPAPEALSTVTLWTSPEPDPRAVTDVKGPELSLGQQLRRKANLHGADEAVLLDSEGHVLEGALSSLVWWRDDVLCAPGPDLPWLPSVTRELVFEIAGQSGFKTRFESVLPEQLNSLEIWTLSALHGIRVVTAWDSLPNGPAPAVHADSFRRRLRMMQSSKI